MFSKHVNGNNRYDEPKRKCKKLETFHEVTNTLP